MSRKFINVLTFIDIKINCYKLLKCPLLSVVLSIICIYYHNNNNKDENNNNDNNNKEK